MESRIKISTRIRILFLILDKIVNATGQEG